jgi:hypothetical protein
LRAVNLTDQWRELAGGLPEEWTEARVLLTLAEDERADEASLMLASLTPGRTGTTFRLTVRRRARPEGVLSRLDRAGIRGRLDVVATDEAGAQPGAPERSRSLAEQWDEVMAGLPADWSDLYAQVDFDSSDYLQRGALLMSPTNPAHYGGATALRFRAARVSGYGVSAGMARRCLTRLDGERLTGRLRILRVLAGTRHSASQGPVWRVGGRSV